MNWYFTWSNNVKDHDYLLGWHVGKQAVRKSFRSLNACVGAICICCDDVLLWNKHQKGTDFSSRVLSFYKTYSANIYLYFHLMTIYFYLFCSLSARNKSHMSLRHWIPDACFLFRSKFTGTGLQISQTFLQGTFKHAFIYWYVTEMRVEESLC